MNNIKRPLTPLEAIIVNMGFQETDKTIGSSFSRGCKIWKTQIEGVFATNYDIQAIYGGSLIGKDCLYFFNPDNGKSLLLSFTFLKDRTSLHLYQNEFLKSK